MRKREEIITSIPEIEDDTLNYYILMYIEELINECENEFIGIKETLTIDHISKLDKVEEAYNLADDAATNLY